MPNKKLSLDSWNFICILFSREWPYRKSPKPTFFYLTRNFKEILFAYIALKIVIFSIALLLTCGGMKDTNIIQLVS
jgi:hypothetical protein